MRTVERSRRQKITRKKEEEEEREMQVMQKVGATRNSREREESS